MALSNFFKINMPYGIKKNENNEWTAFNREYKPLSCNDPFTQIPDSEFVYTNYGKLSDQFLLSLADQPSSVHFDENNTITLVYFYSDSTNPSNFQDNTLWERYFDKLRKLASIPSKSYAH